MARTAKVQFIPVKLSVTEFVASRSTYFAHARVLTVFLCSVSLAHSFHCMGFGHFGERFDQSGQSWTVPDYLLATSSEFPQSCGLNLFTVGSYWMVTVHFWHARRDPKCC